MRQKIEKLTDWKAAQAATAAPYYYLDDRAIGGGVTLVAPWNNVFLTCYITAAADLSDFDATFEPGATFGVVKSP